MVFARSGYHGAGLDQIARVAGFSKGAVYSNFSNKAELFLAVMDINMQVAATVDFDPFERVSAEDQMDEVESEVEDIARGISLATLEFIAVAVRDPELKHALRERVQAMIDMYTRMAQDHANIDETLAVTDLGALLAAFSEGTALLEISNAGDLDQRTVRIGMRRLLDPRRAIEESALDGEEPSGGTRMLDRRLTKAIIHDA